MNTLLFFIVIYFIISIILEILEFKMYIYGKQNLLDSQIIQKQLMIWCWPILIVYGFIFIFCYAFVILACLFIEAINDLVSDVD